MRQQWLWQHRPRYLLAAPLCARSDAARDRQAYFYWQRIERTERRQHITLQNNEIYTRAERNSLNFN